MCGPTARAAIQSMQDGEIILLDNVRFCSEEQTLFEMKLQLTHEQQAQTQVVAQAGSAGGPLRVRRLRRRSPGSALPVRL